MCQRLFETVETLNEAVGSHRREEAQEVEVTEMRDTEELQMVSVPHGGCALRRPRGHRVRHRGPLALGKQGWFPAASGHSIVVNQPGHDLVFSAPPSDFV